MKLSIIVCSYNVEKYIEDCLNSVLRQNYPHMEVICIDDCSTDSTGRILDEYSRKFSIIKVVHNQYNRSVSYSRKLGISLSTGQYIMFLDGDDELCPNACAHLVDTIDHFGVDILQFCTKIVPETDIQASAVQWFDNFVRPYFGDLKGNEVFEGCFSKKIYRFNVWNKIYNSKICKNALKYLDDEPHPKAQDLLLFFIISYLSTSYKGINYVGYIYHYGRGVTGSKTETIDKFLRICTQAKIAKLCKQFLIQMNVYSKYYETYLSLQTDLYLECLSHYRSCIENGIDCTDAFISSWKDLEVYPRAYIDTNSCTKQPYVLNQQPYSGDIPIFFSINENFVQYLSVTLKSLILNKKCSNCYQIYILYEDLSSDSILFFNSLSTQAISLNLVNVKPYLLGHNLYSRGHIGTEMYYRLFIPEILKDTPYSKAIYLDADLIVTSDLLPLYSYELGTYVLGAVYNASLNYSAKRLIDLNIDPLKYINSGVLLINVKEYLKKNVKNHCLRILSTNTTLVNPDQDVLNIVCSNNIKLLPLEWNFIWLYIDLYHSENDPNFKKYCEYYIEHCSQPHIIHYAGKNKPWNSPPTQISIRLHKIYWYYAAKSPYYDKLVLTFRKNTVSPTHHGWYIKVDDYYTYCKSLNKLRISSELKIWYKTKTGKKLNITKPQTFNEKIQWLKIYDSSKLKSDLADKYLARNWIATKIGEKYLVPLLGVWNTFDEINIDSLPESFVLKTNHGSGWNIIVPDKSKFLKEQAKLNFDLWMNLDYAFMSGFEMQYHPISHKIIAEKYIGDASGLIDYRFYCFNGHPQQIWVDKFSGTAKHIREIFDLDWKKIPLKCTWPSAHGELDAKPLNFDKMINFAKILSEPFNFVRVDFFEVNCTLYVGELTFTPMSGIGKFDPTEYDSILGQLLTIPKTPFLSKVSNRLIFPIHCLIRHFEIRKKVQKMDSQQQLRKNVELWINDKKQFDYAITTLKLLDLAGDSWAQRQLASIYQNGINVKKNLDLAMIYLRKSAQSGNNIAKKQLIDILLATKDSEKLSEIFSLRLDLATKGDLNAQRNLSIMYLHGKGVEPNVAQAIYWARSVHNARGNNEDTKVLIDCLVKDNNPDNLPEIFKLRLILAEAGFLNSQQNIALMYRQGVGVDQNIEKAKEWEDIASKNKSNSHKV